MKCLITGCNLYSSYEGKWVHGDLHEVGGALVFNACLRDGDAAWQFGEPPLGSTVIESAGYFERRGVIVLDKFKLSHRVMKALPVMATT